jgi:hypothetical protein
MDRRPVWFRSKHVDDDVYVIAGCVGVRADPVRKIGHLPRLGRVGLRKAKAEFGGDAEAASRAWSDAHGSCDGSFRRIP